MKMSVLPVILFILSCKGISRHIEEKVDHEIVDAKQKMNGDIDQLRNNFISNYQSLVRVSIDSLYKQQLSQLYLVIDNTSVYLDSLKVEMDKMDYKDVNNTFKVKQAFLYNGAGDSIRNKFKRSISTALILVKTKKQKDSIESIDHNLFRETDPYRWKEQLFGLNSSVGAGIIVYGFQSELFRIGTIAMESD